MAGGDGDCLSPLLLTSVESGIETFTARGESMIAAAATNAESLRSALRPLLGFAVADFASKYPEHGFEVDPLKVVFKVEGRSGKDVWDALLTRHKTVIEKVTKRAAVVTVHAHTSAEDMALLIAQVKDLGTGEVAESQHSKVLGASGALSEDTTSLMEAGTPLYK